MVGNLEPSLRFIQGRIPKSLTSRLNQTKNFFMEQLNFHKQKLYSLIIAGVALIALILPWISLGLFGSVNGFHSWGWLSFLGVAGIAVLCFMGDKTKEFDQTFKKAALGCFGAIGAGALIFFLRLSSYGGGFGGVGGSGFGLWLCLIAGVLGFLWISGLIKLPDIKKPQ
jgi:hypothetical protein